MTAESGRPLYFRVNGEAVSAVLHTPAGGQRTTAVLFVPPFGWEDTCSYRARRAWAVALAHDGFPVLRVDLPGTGDSAGTPRDPGRVGAWVAAVKAAASELRRLTGCDAVAAIGLGLGGLLAVAAAGGELDELVLWGAAARGRAVIRELRAFAQLEASRASGAAPLPDGAFGVSGSLVSAETAAEIGALDVRGGGGSGVRRALLLDRDGLAVDDALRAALAAAGTDVTMAAGPGYGAMMAEHQLSVPPLAVIARVSEWLRASAPVADDQPVASPPPTDVIDFDESGVALRERALSLDTPGGPVVGVLSEPDRPGADVCAVFLNAGATRRIGPNRMWVEAARRWAARGVRTARVDLESLGDSPAPDVWGIPDGALYAEHYRAQVSGALDALVAQGLPPRFVLMGLCSGAYWSFQLGQTDPRVRGIVMLNPLALVFDPFVATVRKSREVRRLAQAATWQRILRGDVTKAGTFSVASAVARRAATAPARLPRRLADRKRAREAGGDRLDFELDRLRDNGVEALLVFSNGELLREELAGEGRFARLDRWPNLRLHLLDGPTDTHKLQPLDLQARVHAVIDTVLDPLTRN